MFGDCSSDRFQNSPSSVRGVFIALNDPREMVDMKIRKISAVCARHLVGCLVPSGRSDEHSPAGGSGWRDLCFDWRSGRHFDITDGDRILDRGRRQRGICRRHARSGSQGHGPVLNSDSRTQAHDGSTFSRSQNRTKVKVGEEVRSTTRPMEYQPGSAPMKSKSSISAQ